MHVLFQCMHTGSHINKKHCFYWQVPPPVVDSLGRVVPSDTLDPWDARCGIALALGELSPTLSEEEVYFLMKR